MIIIEIIKIGYSLFTVNNIKLVLGVATPQNIITLSTIYQTTRILIKILETVDIIQSFINNNKKKNRY